MADPFIRTFAAEPGVVEEVHDGVRRILAPNPSPMTFLGTNTYIVGEGDVTVIDPGPDLPDHLAAIRTALGPRQRVGRILVTHPHVDHSPLAARLASETGAPVLGYGPPEAGRAPDMVSLAAAGALRGGEGVDRGFRPDAELRHGDEVQAGGYRLQAVHTPGHFSGHLCFAIAGEGILFSGDQVMSWATTLVSPPDGDLTAFMDSLELLAGRSDRLYLPGHGAPLPEPAAMIDHQRAHRRARETQILDALGAGPEQAVALARRIYTDIPPPLLPAAARNVLAHLIDLARRGLVSAEGGLSERARFHRI